MKKGKGRAACASDAPEKPWLAMADRRVGVCSHRNELCGDARGLEGLQLGQPRGREARRDGVSDGEQHRRVPPAASSPSVSCFCLPILGASPCAGPSLGRFPPRRPWSRPPQP